MTQTASAGFVQWLNGKLRELNTDESVFGSYIVGILEEETESAEEKTDALEGILSEIIENNLQEIITEILNKWEEFHAKDAISAKNATTIDVNEQLARLLEAQKLPTIKEREYSAEERKIKEQILAQYSQTEVSEEEYEGGSDEETTKLNSAKAALSNSGLERNTNAHDVMQLQKERREQARQDSAAKKLKDKDDREKQKQLREEKKEKRKTVKGERRR